MTQLFHSNGKLLITGEYAVLDGALSFALPTVYGQTLKVTENKSGKLLWKSLDQTGNVWFEWVFDMNDPITAQKNVIKNPTANTLAKLLDEAKSLNPLFMANVGGLSIETKLGFPREWGLGSSSTLINNIAQWAKIDAYRLLWNAFSGSGYDIACAQHDTPILYRLNAGKPEVQQIPFDPPFKNELNFIYLNKKQNSREGITRYRAREFDETKFIEDITSLSKKIVQTTTRSDFDAIVLEHEKLVSQVLGMPMVKEAKFSDFTGTIKSLGAWGGDFILASGGIDPIGYFNKKGYDVVIPYSKLIL